MWVIKNRGIKRINGLSAECCPINIRSNGFAASVAESRIFFCSCLYPVVQLP